MIFIFYNLYVKPVDNSFEWNEITSIMNDKVMNQCTIKQNKPLTINKAINIDTFDATLLPNNLCV